MLPAAWNRFLLLVLFTVLVSLGAGAQRNHSPEASGGAEPDPETGQLTTLVADVSEVMLVFSVTIRSGRFVHDLRREDFELADNGQPPSHVGFFQNQTDLPLHVGLLLDLSDSVDNHFAFQQAAAIAFLERVLRPEKDTAFVMGFHGDRVLEQGMTNDVGRLAGAVRRLEVGGNTALFDAVIAASRMLEHTGRGTGRRALVLISDGMDTASSRSLEQSVEAALRAGVVVYALSSNPVRAGIGDHVLRQIATGTGGRLLPARRERELAHAFTRVEEELRSQYALAYKPADLEADGSYRRIELRTRQRGLRVHARPGYFAPRARLR
jgi:Ca-activated chloride channel homolog